ncbi:hypothetical protein ASE48_21910 [Mycobacterium sp. Root265]|nr:hypothetical protein ASE48_21910 [Mycobacterium sp. Root265]
MVGHAPFTEDICERRPRGSLLGGKLFLNGRSFQLDSKSVDAAVNATFGGRLELVADEHAAVVRVDASVNRGALIGLFDSEKVAALNLSPTSTPLSYV